MVVPEFSSPVKGSKPKLIVTGAGGLLGHALCAQALSQWSVMALYRHNKPQIPGIRAIQIDLTDRHALIRLVKALAPEAIIHAAAVAQVDVCEAHPMQSAVVNVAVPARLAEHCADNGIAYLFTSTDLVFDGQQAPYDEQDPVNPVSIYGGQKVRAEKAVLHHYPKALVCRLPLMFGITPYAGRHFTLQMLKAFRQGKAVTLLTDEYRTPVDHLSAAQGLLHLLGSACGLLHLGGRTRISRYDLGCLMATCMNVTTDLIRPVTIDALNLDVARAPDCTLVSEKAYLLGYNPSPLEAAIKALVDKFDKITDV